LPLASFFLLIANRSSSNRSSAKAPLSCADGISSVRKLGPCNVQGWTHGRRLRTPIFGGGLWENERMESKRDAKNDPVARTSIQGWGNHHGEMLQLVGFHVGGEEFALDILRVQEIIRVPELTRVPSSPECMDGVMNLRGKIIPVITLRSRFGLDRVRPNEQTRIVVIETKGNVLGVIVDSVSEVLRIPADSVEPPPRLGKVDREYVSGVGKLDDRLLILLDVDQLMEDRLMEDTGEIPGGEAAHAALTPKQKSL
jgi:purine-binding chemotaxis protein CheW